MGNRVRRGDQEAGSNCEKGRGSTYSSGGRTTTISSHNVPEYMCGAMLHDRCDFVCKNTSVINRLSSTPGSTDKYVPQARVWGVPILSLNLISCIVTKARIKWKCYPARTILPVLSCLATT